MIDAAKKNRGQIQACGQCLNRHINICVTANCLANNQVKQRLAEAFMNCEFKENILVSWKVESTLKTFKLVQVVDKNKNVCQDRTRFELTMFIIVRTLEF